MVSIPLDMLEEELDERGLRGARLRRPDLIDAAVAGTRDAPSGEPAELSITSGARETRARRAKPVLRRDGAGWLVRDP
jgi:hypothetical protein